MCVRGKVGVCGRDWVGVCGRERVGVGLHYSLHEFFHLVLVFLIHYIYSY